jgi:Integrase core domain
VAVRKVWQIASAKIRIGGKSWPANFETIISKVSAGLGCEGICERFVRTIKEGCLDQMILFGEDSLRNAIREFVAHYHLERNHQGLDNRLIRSSNGAPDMTGTVRMRRRLGGMLNYYYCEAA